MSSGIRALPTMYPVRLRGNEWEAADIGIMCKTTKSIYTVCTGRKYFSISDLLQEGKDLDSDHGYFISVGRLLERHNIPIVKVQLTDYEELTDGSILQFGGRWGCIFATEQNALDFISRTKFFADCPDNFKIRTSTDMYLPIESLCADVPASEPFQSVPQLRVVKVTPIAPPAKLEQKRKLDDGALQIPTTPNSTSKLCVSNVTPTTRPGKKLKLENSVQIPISSAHSIHHQQAEYGDGFDGPIHTPNKCKRTMKVVEEQTPTTSNPTSRSTSIIVSPYPLPTIDTSNVISAINNADSMPRSDAVMFSATDTSNEGWKFIPPNRPTPQNMKLQHDDVLKGMVCDHSKKKNTVIDYLLRRCHWIKLEFVDQPIDTSGRALLFEPVPRLFEIRTYFAPGWCDANNNIAPNLQVNYHYFTTEDFVLEFLEHIFNVPPSERRKMSHQSELPPVRRRIPPKRDPLFVPSRTLNV